MSLRFSGSPPVKTIRRAPTCWIRSMIRSAAFVPTGCSKPCGPQQDGHSWLQSEVTWKSIVTTGGEPPMVSPVGGLDLRLTMLLPPPGDPVLRLPGGIGGVLVSVAGQDL